MAGLVESRLAGQCVVDNYWQNPANVQHFLDTAQHRDRFNDVCEYLNYNCDKLTLVSKPNQKVLYLDGKVIAANLGFAHMLTLKTMLDRQDNCLECLWVKADQNFDKIEHVVMPTRSMVIDFEDFLSYNGWYACELVKILSFGKKCGASDLMFKWTARGNMCSERLFPVLQMIIDSSSEDMLKKIGCTYNRLGFYMRDVVGLPEFQAAMLALSDLFGKYRPNNYPNIDGLFSRVSGIYFNLESTIRCAHDDAMAAADISHYKGLVKMLTETWNMLAYQGSIKKLICVQKVIVHKELRIRGRDVFVPDPQAKSYSVPALYAAPLYGVPHY